MGYRVHTGASLTRRALCGAFSTAVALLGVPALAEGEDAGETKLACAKSYESAQRLRKDGSLVEARTQAIVCAQSECPSVLSADCGKWVEELDASLPTHVFELLGEGGQPLGGVQVSVDGGEFEANKGRALPLDPGSHEVVFRTADGQEVTKQFIATEGKRGVLVQASVPFVSSAVSAVPAQDAPLVPTATWVFGGVGVVGLAAFATFALVGKNKENGLDCTEVSLCNRDEGDAAKAMYLGADISLAIGAAALATGGAFWLFSSHGDETQVGLAPEVGGASVAWSGSF